MQTKAQLMHVYDAIAQNYGGYRRRPWPALANFLKKVEKSALILDLGCGNTPYSNSLKNKKIVGLDFSFGQLGLARKNLKLLVQADASELPFKSETFDYIIFIAALHHLLNNKQRLQALKEARRVTKRGGRILVSVWSRWQRRFFPLNLFKANLLVSFGQYSRFYHLFSQRELETLTAQAGFRVEKAFKQRNNIFLIGRAWV